MKRTISLAMILVALAVVVAVMHSQQAAAQRLPQSQIKPTPTPDPGRLPKLFWLSRITLDKTNTVGGSVNGDITGTIHLMRSASSNLTVTLSTEGCVLDEAGILVATLPSRTVIVPAGSDHATFRIQTFSSPNTSNPITCSVSAHYGEETRTASFTVEPLLMTSFTINPAAGTGPFAATATIVLNAPPAVNKTVTLTSSNAVVQFGSGGSAQPNGSVIFTSSRSQGTVQLVAGRVTQATTATITATLGAQTRTAQISVRPAF